MSFAALFATLFGLLINLGILYLIYRVITAWGRRRLVERVVIGQITSVLRQNLPLARGLAVAADSERGAPAVHLRRIARLLEQGMTLSHSIRIGYPDCSSMTRSLIQAGERADQLPAVLDRIEQTMLEKDRSTSGKGFWPLFYVLLVTVPILFTLTFVMVAVVPKFEEIFADFGTDLPWAMRVVINASGWLVQGTPPGFVFFIPPLMAVPVFFYLSYRHRHVEHLSGVSRFADAIRWRVPGYHKYELARGMHAITDVLRLSLKSGLDMPAAARLAAEVDANHVLREQMRRYAEELERGQPVDRALKTAGANSMLVMAISAGVRTGHLDTPLAFAAEYYRAIVSRWWLFIQNMGVPLLTLFFAVIVGFLAYAFFLPLIKLINSVMSTV
jgi:type IV pilus assembly protein PilC